MQKQIKKLKQKEQGFSLIELMVVIAIIILISSITVHRLYSSSLEVGGAERLLDEVASRISERRAEARRLNGDDRRVDLESFTVEPLPIDFSDLSWTGSLNTEGADSDGNCEDDHTGRDLTCLIVSGERAEWRLAFNDDALKLPTGWQVARNSRVIRVPLIGNGMNGRGVLASAFGFDADGKAYAKEFGSNEWKNIPTGALKSEQPTANDAPFWAIYFVVSGGVIRGSEPNALVAVAVHPSGLVEKFRYDNGEWIGFKNRTVK